jgi:phage repressor protein C with HTH and peptisase S24 domain
MANRIRDFRQRAGLSMQALADLAGTSAPQINKLEKGERRLTVDWMVRLGRALSVDPKELMLIEEGATEAVPLGGGSPAPNLGSTPVHFSKPDLPVLGRPRGGPGGGLILPVEPQPVDWTYRPPQLRGVADAFAVYAGDDSMHPMYKHGQTLWVHPHLPAKPGDGVLVIMGEDEGVVRELVQRGESEILLRQYRPEIDSTVPQAAIRAVYRIIGTLDLR